MILHLDNFPKNQHCTIKRNKGGFYVEPRVAAVLGIGVFNEHLGPLAQRRLEVKN